MSASCCAPADGRAPVAAGGLTLLTIPPVGRPDGTPPTADLVDLPGGSFRMGSEGPEVNPGDGEAPVREVTVSPFAIGRNPVTNREFARFVAATGHRTGAELFGWSYVFAAFLPAHLRRGAQRPDAVPWWCRVDGALWSAPEGPGSDVSDRMDHPVVHVDHADALAYCSWAGLRLPTEAEWEYAARGGLDGRRYAWGDELTPGGVHRCNIWQGSFPVRNTADDGYKGTSPVGAYAPNGFGLNDVAGNVWEWCADWWSPTPDLAATHDPRGPAKGELRVMRGGSYLCHASYCNRYRVAARTSNDPASCSGNIGFRYARDLAERGR